MAETSDRDEVLLVVDRIEGSLAVLVSDSGDEETVPVRLLPSGVREGAVLRVTRDAAEGFLWSTARLDPAEAERRLDRARRMLEELSEQDTGSDLEL
ncbi:MAG: DUF3006 domain-containing protein [Gemmatimonadota bacterium]